MSILKSAAAITVFAILFLGIFFLRTEVYLHTHTVILSGSTNHSFEVDHTAESLKRNSAS